MPENRAKKKGLKHNSILKWVRSINKMIQDMKEQQKSELKKLRNGIKEFRKEHKIIKEMTSILEWMWEERHTIAHSVKEIEDEKEENFQDKKINEVIKTYSSYINVYIWSLGRWYWWTYLQSSSGDADIEKDLWTCGKGEGGMNRESSIETRTVLCVK